MTATASSETVDALMAVYGIAKVFGDQQVLADVSFEVTSGEILGLIGPNGAGKTTLLECIAGLLAADTGEVRWRGRPATPRTTQRAALLRARGDLALSGSADGGGANILPAGTAPAAVSGRAPGACA